MTAESALDYTTGGMPLISYADVNMRVILMVRAFKGSTRYHCYFSKGWCCAKLEGCAVWRRLPLLGMIH